MATRSPNLKRPELLSPAGTLRNQRYALAYGADAVYAGQPRYSLRTRENDFDLSNLETGIKEAHNFGKRFYVASNVLPHNAKVKTYMEKTVESCEEKGYVETLTGRRRYIRDILSSNQTTKGGAERVAINAPLQGTAADLIKIAMINVQDALKKGGYKSRMLLQVHDELVFDVWEDEEKELQPLIEKCMKNALSMKVPIDVELGIGSNWLEAH